MLGQKKQDEKKPAEAGYGEAGLAARRFTYQS
jgi:hypothetical protein